MVQFTTKKKALSKIAYSCMTILNIHEKLNIAKHAKNRFQAIKLTEYPPASPDVYPKGKFSQESKIYAN